MVGPEKQKHSWKCLGLLILELNGMFIVQYSLSLYLNNNMKVFFSSPGKRVELIKIFKKEIKDVIVMGGDYSGNSPALLFCDKTFTLPFKIDENYIKEVLRICIQEKINFLIPLIDHELELYSKYRYMFNQNNIEIMISDEKSITMSSDKMKTFDFFVKHNFLKNPFTSLLKKFDEANFENELLILKPKNGSSSIGIHKVKKKDITEYARMMELDKNQYIVQEYIDFDFEVTTDVFIDKDNRLIELCQRKRLKVRGGEVERAVTIKDTKINEIIDKIIQETSFFGVINIQIMIKDNEYFIGEINPRFGGGFPLSYYSGANMIEHIKNQIKGKKLTKFQDSRYLNNFFMLRFDDAIYTQDIKND